MRGRGLERPGRLLEPDHGGDARLRADDGRRQRLPGRHAGGADRSRSQQGGRPRREHGRHRRHHRRRHRRHPQRQVQGQGPALRHPRAPARRSSGSGRRTSASCSCARPAASWCAWPTSSPSSQQPTLQAITRKDRQRAITIFANVAPGVLPGRRHRQRPEARRRASCPRATPRCALRIHPGLPGVVQLARLRVRARHHRRLHGAGLAVQRLHPPVHGAPRPALQRERRPARAVAGRAEH